MSTSIDGLRSIWITKVYDANSPCDVYHFGDKKDLMESIHTTWSKKMDTIKIHDDERTNVVTVRSCDEERVFLVAHAVSPRQLIDKPTHF